MNNKTGILIILILLISSLVSIETGIAKVVSLTIATDKVESLVEITDIVEKESLNSIDFTQFSPLTNNPNINVIKNYLWSFDGSKLLVRAEVPLRTKNASADDKKNFARCSEGPFGVPEGVFSLFWINVDGSGFTDIARAEESIRAASNNTYTAIMDGGWNLDGDKIVFQIFNGCGGSGKKLYVSDRNGSILAETNGSEFMQWNPDRNRVAILESGNEKSVISIIDIRNYTVKQLSLNISIAGYYMIKWSPDGEKIAFIGNENIYMTNAYDFSVRQLTTGIKAKELSWKRDGTKLLFIAEDGLYIMDADGSNSTLIEKGNFNLVRWGPQFLLESWSSDGKKIVLSKRINEKEIFGKFYILVIDGTATKLIAAAPDLGKYSSFVSWGPDGKKMLFSETDETGKLDKLHFFDIESGKAKPMASALVVENVNPESITWSPNSERIAFYSFESKSIYTVNSDGTDRVAIPESYYEYIWGLDNKIYSFTNGALIKVNQDGTEQLPLAKDFPTYDNWHHIYLSPDGSRILFASGNYSTKQERIYILKMKGYDEVMSIYVPNSIREEDNALIEVKSISKPVENATITLNGKEIGKTNENGYLKYKFEDAGYYKLNAIKQGFRTANKSIAIKERGQSPEPTITTAASAPTVVDATPRSLGFSSIFAVIALILTIYLIKKIRRIK